MGSANIISYCILQLILYRDKEDMFNYLIYNSTFINQSITSLLD